MRKRAPLFALVAVFLLAAALPIDLRAEVQIPLPAQGMGHVVDPITHQIWVLTASGLLRVDGGTYATQSVALAGQPKAILVDPIRNLVYVLRTSGSPFGTVTRVDGRTLATQTVATGAGAIALDPGRNRIYVATSNSVVVIRGDDLSSSTIALPSPYPGGSAGALAVDPLADRVYTGLLDADLDPFMVQIRPDPPALLDSLAVQSPLYVTSAVAADPVTGFSYLQHSFPFAGYSLFRANWASHTALDSPEGGVAAVLEPTAGRIWELLDFDGMSCNGSLRAVDLGTLDAVPGTRQTGCDGRSFAVNPATARAYAVDSSLFDPYALNVWVIDPATPAITSFAFGPFSADGGAIDVDVAANKIYLQRTGVLSVLDEPVAAPVPLPVTITLGTPSPGGTPVSFSATTGFAPHPLPIRQIYYQVDATDGTWLAATPAGASASATLTGLAQGTHVVYAFATDGQEATLSSSQRTVIVGPVKSQSFDAPAPSACANGIDDDGDGLVDYPADPGCMSANSMRENPQCNNGLDDDGDGAIDYPADTHCRAAWDNDELSDPSGGCGLGAELALILAVLRRRSRLHRT